MTASFSFARARISASSSRISSGVRSLPHWGLATGSWTWTAGRVMRALGLARAGRAGGRTLSGRGRGAQPLLLRSGSRQGNGGGVKLAVTTSLHPTPAERDAARAAARRWGLAFAERGKRSLEEARVGA